MRRRDVARILDKGEWVEGLSASSPLLREARYRLEMRMARLEDDVTEGRDRLAAMELELEAARMATSRLHRLVEEHWVGRGTAARPRRPEPRQPESEDSWSVVAEG